MRNIRKAVFGLLLIGMTVCVAAESLKDWGTQQGRKVALPELIKIICGHEVYDWDEALAPTLKQVAETVVERVKRQPIHTDRINEVGNAVELYVLDALASAGMTSGRPSPLSGRKKTAGYPDLFAKKGDDYFYIEIKTYSPRTENSSQRTFYISPSNDFKVTRDAYHLALAFSTEEISDGVYSLTGFKLLDLYGLKCQLKMEFNASNRDLYSRDRGLIVEEGD